MGGKCSNCGNVGHNSRTCKVVKLFGVHLHASSPSAVATTKNASMDCSDSSRGSTKENFDKPADGYLSDGPSPGVPEKKKRIPWTEEEHTSFLAGIEKLGKGRWTRISREYVTTRTPAQVSSHGHNYFLRQNALDKERRSGLFDTVDSSKTNQSQPTAKSKNPVPFLG